MSVRTESTKSVTKESSFTILGVRVDPLSHAAVLARVNDFLRLPAKEGALTVTAASMNNLSVARKDPKYLRVLNSFDLVVPDGAPLYWLARRNGAGLIRRTYGPDLMRTAILDGPASYRHFVLGGSEVALKLCCEKLEVARPGAVVGAYSPPFGSWTTEENERIHERIALSAANIVWVCIGAPRQDLWIAAQAERYPGTVLAAVGAAVDFIAELKPQAPALLQNSGLEWLFRLLTEPKRLWRRYLVDMPPTVLAMVSELYSKGKREA